MIWLVINIDAAPYGVGDEEHLNYFLDELSNEGFTTKVIWYMGEVQVYVRIALFQPLRPYYYQPPLPAIITTNH